MHKPSPPRERRSLGNPWANPISKNIRALFLGWLATFGAALVPPRLLRASDPAVAQKIDSQGLTPERIGLGALVIVLLLVALILAAKCAWRTHKNKTDLRRRVISLGYIPILITLGGLVGLLSMLLSGRG